MTKQIKTLRGKFLPVLMILLVICSRGHAQYWQRIPYYEQMRGFRVDSLFGFPKDTTVHPGTSDAAVGRWAARQGDSIYVWSIYSRKYVLAGGAGGTTYTIGYGLFYSAPTLRVDTSKVATLRQVDSAQRIPHNVYTLPPLFAVNDSTFSLDTTLMQTRLRGLKLFDSTKSLIGTVFGDAIKSANQTFSGQNTFSNAVFKLTNTPWNPDVTKTKIPVIDTTTGIVGHQAGVYVDLTGIGVNDHIKWDATNQKFIKDNTIYWSGAANYQIPRGNGLGYTQGPELGFDGITLFIRPLTFGAELSLKGSDVSVPHTWRIVGADATDYSPAKGFVIIHNQGVGTFQFAIDTNDVVIMPAGVRYAVKGVADVAYTISKHDNIIAYTTLSATRAVTAPSSPVVGDTYIIKDQAGTAGTNNITFVGTLDGASNPTIINTNGGARCIYYSGASGFFTLWKN